jgi:competence protein ComEA
LNFLYRDLLGGFYSVRQLMEVYGMPDSTFSLIAGRLRSDSTGVKQIDINKASFSDLIRHPYLERYDVQAILKYREIKGRIEGTAELTRHSCA